MHKLKKRSGFAGIEYIGIGLFFAAFVTAASVYEFNILTTQNLLFVSLLAGILSLIFAALLIAKIAQAEPGNNKMKHFLQDCPHYATILKKQRGENSALCLHFAHHFYMPLLS